MAMRAMNVHRTKEEALRTVPPAAAVGKSPRHAVKPAMRQHQFRP
jgi:hypothetical protein